MSPDEIDGARPGRVVLREPDQTLVRGGVDDDDVAEEMDGVPGREKARSLRLQPGEEPRWDEGRLEGADQSTSNVGSKARSVGGPEFRWERVFDKTRKNEMTCFVYWSTA